MAKNRPRPSGKTPVKAARPAEPRARGRASGGRKPAPRHATAKEEQREVDEQSRRGAEEQRQHAEKGRVQAEDLRQELEELRQEHEVTRATAEKARNTAEKVRAEAHDTRRTLARLSRAFLEQDEVIKEMRKGLRA